MRFEPRKPTTDADAEPLPRTNDWGRALPFPTCPEDDRWIGVRHPVLVPSAVDDGLPCPVLTNEGLYHVFDLVAGLALCDLIPGAPERISCPRVAPATGWERTTPELRTGCLRTNVGPTPLPRRIAGLPLRDLVPRSVERTIGVRFPCVLFPELALAELFGRAKIDVADCVLEDCRLGRAFDDLCEPEDLLPL